MRKKHLIGALVAVVAMAFAAVAIASPQFNQEANIKYTVGKAKKPSGIKANLVATDPGAQPAGNLPPVNTVKITLAGSKIDTTAGKQCKLPANDAPNCPRDTRIGGGTASANLVGTNPTTGQPNVTQGLAQTVDAYLKSGGIYFVVRGVTLPTTAILNAKLTKRGVLTVNVERDLPKIPGGNKIILTDFQTNLKKVTKGRGKNLKALVTTPACGKSKKFTITTKFTYGGGQGPKTIKSTTPCKK